MTTVEEALGRDASLVMPPAMRTQKLTVRLPLYQIALLNILAEEGRESVNTFLRTRIGDLRRKAPHERAAELIEKNCTTEAQLNLHAAELARHFDAAAVQDKAVSYYERAAEWAVGSGACREAVELMTRAIALDRGRRKDHHPARANSRADRMLDRIRVIVPAVA